MKKHNSKIISAVLIFSVFFAFSSYPKMANAASFSVIKDTMSTQALNTPADHTVTWTPNGHTNAVNGVVTIDFADNPTFVSSGTWTTSDFAYTDNVRTAAAPTAVGQTGSLVSCSGSGASNYIVNVTPATNTFVMTFCTGWTASDNTTARTLKILGASGGTGTFLTNASTDTDSSLFTITDSVNDTDSGSGAIVIEQNDVVTVTATVNPVLTFSVGTSTIALGTLSSGSTAVSSHTIAVTTNATGGFALTYNGPTLTSGSSTIPAYSSLSSSVSGTAGFGINLKSNSAPSIGSNPTTNAGTCNVSSDYNTTNKFTWVASTPTQIASSPSVADCSYTVSYVANISSVTPAGSYSSATTYIATGTF